MEIKVKSKKHGEHTILVDDEDFEFVNRYKWSIFKHGKYNSRMYAVNCSERTIRMHRFIIGDACIGMDIDHINCNGLDNRKANLRICSRFQNNGNRRKQTSTSSRYKGVWWHKQCEKWGANIGLNNKMIYIGIFNTEIEAAIAYNNKAKELFGPFALLNDLHV